MYLNVNLKVYATKGRPLTLSGTWLVWLTKCAILVNTNILGRQMREDWWTMLERVFDGEEEVVLLSQAKQLIHKEIHRRSQRHKEITIHSLVQRIFPTIYSWVYGATFSFPAVYLMPLILKCIHITKIPITNT